MLTRKILKENIMFKYMALFVFSVLCLPYPHCISKSISKTHESFKYFDFGYDREIDKQSNINILLARFRKADCGVQHHIFALYKLLLDEGIKVNIVVIQNTSLQKRLYNARLPHFAISENPKDEFNHFYSATSKICKQTKANIIHINGANLEYRVAQAVAKDLNLAIIQQHHDYKEPNLNICKNIDALILVSPELTIRLPQKDIYKNINVKFIVFFPPLCNEEKFLNFKPMYSKKDFFKEKFGIDIKKSPILCTVANFYYCKNHETLFKAIHNLIFKYKNEVQLVLAGTGTSKRITQLKKLCIDLKIDSNVYFLNFVEDIPELLYHSDIKILPSIGEAFSIAIIEASLMKKPIILSKTAGSANLLIKDMETGLLCDPYDAEDIAAQINKILNNKDLALKLSENVYSFVVKNFSRKNIGQIYINLYEKVLNNSRK